QMDMTAGWVESVRKQLDSIEDQRRGLLEGPLGLLLGHRTPAALDAATMAGQETLARPMNMNAPPIIAAVAKQSPANGLLSRHLVLRIDGVGSFLLLRGDRIGIGRSGPDATADLQLMSDLSERQAEIVRAGEDYFLVSMSGVELAGRPVEHALLQDGDRIRLGNRVKLKFQRPSLKSSTAVLDLGEGVRAASDCRRVILWSGPLLMGGTRECHVPVRGAAIGAILLERGGQITVRPMGPGGSAISLAMGVPVEFGGLRMSVQEVSRGSGLGKVIG
ncbi:MAG: FHA domain-containing protein, partial [Planctomycetota bacterium]